MAIIHAEQIIQLATANAERYQSAQPFPHIMLDNFLSEPVINAAIDAFPKPNELEFYQYDNPLEKKLAFDQINKLPSPIRDILYTFNAPVFLRFLEILTGIDGLIPDPYYRGGGIHQIEKGGKLDIHIDFNRYNKLNLYRRLNVLLYLNKDWNEEFGGHFELWKGRKIAGTHILESCEKRILPLLNRLVIFTTSENSYHGHPDPLTCPDGFTRKSIATYYYTVASAENAKNTPDHSTTFIKRPQDFEDPALEELRTKRNQGRLASNVKSEFTA